ncbi:hypothetical protein CEY15_16730 [Dietzia natronolimnaea]|uniref:Uncharacterized protein n=1 Tax=Dietzia natronolimnaea TaxID=161920 RepID=A0A2A2WKU5_9ACTN|nr:hypothetical protein [Dietzia natronolimnaea]MDZ4232951.1 hypothetical protein [Dietzia sp.]PAY21829.1 hypothetical protein CEY15_16730 [Dietzia natronolimnaea]
MVAVPRMPAVPGVPAVILVPGVMLPRVAVARGVTGLVPVMVVGYRGALVCTGLVVVGVVMLTMWLAHVFTSLIVGCDAVGLIVQFQ